MHNTYNIHKGFFEPCHIDTEVSPFLIFERKSVAHEERFSAPVKAEAVTDFSKKAGENGNMQKNNNNMSNLQFTF